MKHHFLRALRNSTPAKERQRGFSLIEIALVLVIAGIALGAGLSLLGAKTAQAKIDSTKTRTEAVRQALVAFVSQNYRLPCPAAPGLVRGAAGYNTEQRSGVAGAEVCTAASGLANNIGGAAPAGVSRGTVPCASLGLADEACTDAWGNRFTYFVRNSAIRLTVNTVSGMGGSMTVHKIIPPAAVVLTNGAAPTGNQINACSTTAGDNSCNLAAVAVVISHGANRGGGFVPESAAAFPTAGVSAYEVANTDNNIQFLQNDYVESGANSFDDIVLAIAPRDVISSLSQNNVLKDPKVLMAEQFETLKLAILQNIYTSMSGTTPNRQITLPTESGAAAPYVFPPTVDFTGCTAPVTTLLLPTTVPALTGLTNDLWGNAIRYRRASTGAFGAANACTTPFVFVSYGPDGQTGGAGNIFGLDDIVFPVTQAVINSAIVKFGGW
ncbi:prepilin-type N-terminal cleavage/methylation domain-containing protein [Polaromonas sp.]|uniref:prepilin-type N-terminal cleavage/methylation domain-containing protein n=1 Tax=Polaromonas sp. TaxID=1869339 RepID=UPI003C8205B2